MHPFLDLSPSLGDAILSLNPTAYWPLDDSGSPLRDAVNRYPATVTGSPTYGVAAPSPIGRGVTFSGTGQYAVSGTGVPNPAGTTITVMSIFATSNATAASRCMATRYTAAQPSWQIYLSSAHKATFGVWQSGGATHASASSVASANTGSWCIAWGTYDGTTVAIDLNGVIATSTSLTGSWYTSPTVGISIAATVGGGNLYTGTVAHVAYWPSVIPAASRRWIDSIVRGA